MTAAAHPVARRDVRLAAWQVRYELRALWRNGRAAVFAFVFPVLLLVMFGTINEGQTLDTRGGLPYVTFYVPGILAYGVLTSCFMSLAMSLSFARSTGQLKRVQGTPLPWWAFIVGRVGAALVLAGAMTATVLALGWLAYGVPVRAATLPGLIVTLALGVTCFTLLGIGVSRVISAESGGPILGVVIFPVAFVSGVFFPMDGAPGWLLTIGDVLPLHPLADGLQTAFDPQTAGPGFVGVDLLTLGAWTLVGVWLMMRFVRSMTRRA
jgi:ABC-2 type transport system permease protein